MDHAISNNSKRSTKSSKFFLKNLKILKQKLSPGEEEGGVMEEGEHNTGTLEASDGSGREGKPIAQTETKSGNEEPLEKISLGWSDKLTKDPRRNKKRFL